MTRLMHTIVFAFIMFYTVTQFTVNAVVQLKFTNLQCTTVDPSFVTFHLCKLKVMKRNVVTVNIDAELHHKVTNCVINACHFKKASGYKPFLFNTTFDFCNYKMNFATAMLAKVLMNFISEYSNLNHTCPYEHNIIVKDLLLTEEKFLKIPLPSGEYMEKMSFYENGELRAIIKVFYSRIE